MIVRISQWNRKCGIVVKDLPLQNRLIGFCWVLSTMFRWNQKAYNDLTCAIDNFHNYRKMWFFFIFFRWVKICRTLNFKCLVYLRHLDQFVNLIKMHQNNFSPKTWIFTFLNPKNVKWMKTIPKHLWTLLHWNVHDKVKINSILLVP